MHIESWRISCLLLVDGTSQPRHTLASSLATVVRRPNIHHVSFVRRDLRESKSVRCAIDMKIRRVTELLFESRFFEFIYSASPRQNKLVSTGLTLQRMLLGTINQSEINTCCTNWKYDLAVYLILMWLGYGWREISKHKPHFI